jgi:hypothetical protein
MKLIKDTDTPDNTEVMIVDPQQIAQIATDYTIKTIGAIGVVIAANRVLKTICDIAIVTAQAKIK